MSSRLAMLPSPSGSLLRHFRDIVRRAAPLQSSLMCPARQEAIQTRHNSSATFRRCSLTGLKHVHMTNGKSQTVSLSDYKLIRMHEQHYGSFSYVDQNGCDMRSQRRKIKEEINRRFPWVKIKMPMYGPLFRNDIVLSPFHSPAEEYVTKQFSNNASTIMKIPPEVDFQREYVLLEKTELSKSFNHPISLAIKERDVFLTAHINEIEKLKKLAKDLVLKSGIASVSISGLDAETHEAVQKYSDWFIPKEFEKFAEPLQFDQEEGSIVVKGKQEAVSLIEYRVNQLIRYHTDPEKDSILIPKTLLTILRQDLEERKLSEQFPTVTALLHSWKEDEILISGQSSTELTQFKDWFQSSHLKQYHTSVRKLNRYQTAVAERLLAPYLKTGAASLSAHSDEGSDLEFSFYTDRQAGRGKFSILRAVRKLNTVPLNNPVIHQFLKINGQELLPGGRRLTEVSYILSPDVVILFGASREERLREKAAMEKLIDGLFVEEIPLPHELFMSIVERENGKKLRAAHKGASYIVAEDASKIFVVSVAQKKEMAEGLVKKLRQEINELDVMIYTPNTDLQSLPLNDDPRLTEYATKHQVSIRRMPSNDQEKVSWQIYGKKELVQNLMNLLVEKEREDTEGKVMEHVQAIDYSTWHWYMLYARQLEDQDGAIKCFYDDNLRSPPGKITFLGPKDEVASALEDLQNFEKLQVDSKVSAEMDMTEEDLDIASSIQLSFPNTTIFTNPDKTGLVFQSECLASVKLAEEYTKQFFGRFERIELSISDKHWIFLTQNWDSIKDSMKRICRKAGVKFQRNLAERSLVLYGLPGHTTIVKERLDTYFLKHHQIRDMLQTHDHDEELTKTVEVDSEKLQAILDPDLGRFRHSHRYVSLQSLMGKYGSGKTYIKLKAKSGNILNAAAASLRRLEADISLKDYPISESIKAMVEDIERASPNYDWLFHKGTKKVRVKLERSSPQFNIAYKSRTDLEEAEKMLEEHFKTLKCLREIELPTKKMGRAMTDVTDYMKTLEQQSGVSAILSETENKILVFGEEEEVRVTVAKLTAMLDLEKWEMFKVRLDGCKDVKTAVQIRYQILKMFPYLMVDTIPESWSSSDTDIELKIATLAEKLIQYPGTKPQLDQLIRVRQSLS